MDWIEEQSRHIAAHRFHLEEAIAQLKVLFNPWPCKHSLEEEQSQDKHEAGCGLKAGQNRDREKAGESEISAEEQAGVSMVDKLLSHAQRARDVQKKLEKPKKTKGREIVTKVREQTHTVSAAEKGKTDKTSAKNQVESSSQDKSIKEKNYSKQDSKLTSKSSSQMKPGSASSATDKQQRSHVSARPQSASGKKHIPVHSNAPFQTNPRLATVKLQSTYRAANASTTSKARLQARGGSASRGRGQHSSKPTVMNSVPKHNENTKSQDKPQSVIRREEKGCDISGASSSSNPSNDSFEDTVFSHENKKAQPHLTEDMNKKFKDMNINQEDTTDAPGKNAMCEDDGSSKLFLLSRDASQLKVPGKLRKAVSQNRKLRQHLYTETVTQKVDTPTAINDFPNQLDHLFGCEEAKQVQLQEKQANYLVNVYTNLTHILDSLHLDILSDQWSGVEVYRAKCLMELLLTTYQHAEQLLHQADFRLLTKASTSQPSVDLTDHGVSSTSQWYHRGNNPGSPDPIQTLKYSSSRDLERYMDAMFTIQHLQLQLDGWEHVANTVFQALDTLDPTSSDYIQTLRTGYSLLSEKRCRVPVLIKDTIPEQETTHDGQW
ncbi:uncharacterized protein LOC128243273 [Mya arenaria]|uniref:uncharacterized protein LOC128243273 n=1 Tax=Mya arenaria TaxID=6604 RepID=UPI0022E33AC3|nr:uncharacterized protein LOC128243273 [Mya arenaria]